MGGFLALFWNAEDDLAASEARAVEARVTATSGWTSIHRDADVRIWGRGRKHPTVYGQGSVLAVGICLRHGSCEPVRVADLHPHVTARATAERLCRESWGAYVGLLQDGTTRSLFRDPSGGLECFTWSIGRVRLVTSQAGPPDAGLFPPRATLNWDVIASWTVDRGQGAIASGLDGIEIVPPGCLLRPGAAERGPTLIWRPSKVASTFDGRDVAEALVDSVGLAVEGLIGAHDLVLDELSGGLDSAVVAASIVQRGLAPRVATCLNYFGDRAESDERRYARAAAEHLGLPLTCVAKPVNALTEVDFVEVARGLRPGFPATDPARDRDTAARLETSGASALVTGHGGDLVFFQMPTPLVAADRLQTDGLRGLSAAYLGDVARFTRKPVWSILGGLARPSRLDLYKQSELMRGAYSAPFAVDPWTEDTKSLLPAKRLQVTSLFSAQLARGWSRREAAADILNPLLAQPVVEFCLGLPVSVLVEGGRDRALVRRAFRHRLPALLVDRRSKGELNAHYGRMIAASLGYLRPLLLDGCLVEAGLLDRPALESALTPEHLILDRSASEILFAAVIENWVRWWQTRVPDSPQASRPRP
ncbi:asparagine synthase-related protein [Phenylobacterium sp.]|uniref:asparagine synthase-related protein n=1 Tax=Phenylobacterium sp. TaxID=1871053 RepID=UPI00356933A3